MKLPIISNTKGFLLSEIMVAFALMTLFLTSAITLSASMTQIRTLAYQKMDHAGWLFHNMSSSTIFTTKKFGNNSIEHTVEPLAFTTSRHNDEWGKDTCNIKLEANPQSLELYTQKITIGLGNVSTDIEVKNGYVYLAADSSSASPADVFIIDSRNAETPIIVSSINTGPGLSSLEVAGPYVYASSLSTTNQLQIIDISNRFTPNLVTRYKLPTPDASTTPPFATSIFYHKGFIYLGTEKWSGPELNVIDVSDPLQPKYLGGFETNTLINSIYVYENRAYVAASDSGQLRILDITNPQNIFLISQLSPSGWETQQGKVVSVFEDHITLGRTVGGFNQQTNHEIFKISSTSTSSRDIPGGVYGAVQRPPFVYLATRNPGREFLILTENMSPYFEKSLGSQPAALSCDANSFYFATGDHWGYAALKNP